MGTAVSSARREVRVVAVWLAVSLPRSGCGRSVAARVDGPRRRSGGCGLAGRSGEHRRFQRTRPPYVDNEWRGTVQRRPPPARVPHTAHRRIAAIRRGRAAGHRAANGRVVCPAIRARCWRFLGRRRSHRAQGGDTNRNRHAAEGGSDRCDGYRTDRGSGPDRRHEEERRG